MTARFSGYTIRLVARRAREVRTMAPTFVKRISFSRSCSTFIIMEDPRVLLHIMGKRLQLFLFLVKMNDSNRISEARGS